MESWPSGRRHLPAKKACGHKPASRVRISYSPPEHFDLKDINKFDVYIIGAQNLRINALLRKIASITKTITGGATITAAIDNTHRYNINHLTIKQ